MPVTSALLQPLIKLPNEPPVLVWEKGIASDTVWLCQTCAGSLKNNRVPELAAANGLDFGIIPDCLKDLNIIEKVQQAQVL